MFELTFNLKLVKLDFSLYTVDYLGKFLYIGWAKNHT